MTLRISSNFDSGAIEVLSLDKPDDIRLRLRADQGVGGDAAFRQWFHFRLHGAAGQAVRLVFENAAEAAYPDGWPDYRCVASYDRRNWFRIRETRYENGQLDCRTHARAQQHLLTPTSSPIPTSATWICSAAWKCRPTPRSAIWVPPWTGVIWISSPSAARRRARFPIWIIARQHPGESMAEWFVEGLLERLLDGADPVARRIREKAVLYIVPNMNPDGAIRGNLRTNAAGANLNREWREPSA
jgi:murein tripeptide amidase MpaA